MKMVVMVDSDFDRDSGGCGGRLGVMLFKKNRLVVIDCGYSVV